VVVLNSAKEVVVNNTYTELIKNTKDEQKNVSEGSDFIVKQYLLLPGYYTLNFSMREKLGTLESAQEISFEVKDFSTKEFVFSDLMIVSDYKENEAGKKSITPLINNNIGNLKEFFLFFEIYYNRDLPFPAEFSYRIIKDKGKTVVEGNFNYVLQNGENKKIEKIPTDNFSMGDFTIEIVNKKNTDVVAGKNFIFKWGDLPVSLKDLDEAIDEMQYIASDDDLDYIKAAKTNAEKEQRFIKFWRDNDPSPNTPRNELMIAYYNRVKIANDRYTQYYKKGWKSDMGMVYIIYGEPGNIERHLYSDYEKPYEIWDYYDIQKRFVFVDDSGFGDYRLITPIWDKKATRL
jgi:GWxTD domain-containing protein